MADPGVFPTTYTTVSCGDLNGIFFVGDTVDLTLNKSGADAYEIRNYYGDVMDSGSVSGTTISISSESWPCGWYRIYLTGPIHDDLHGYEYSYGAYNFVVIRNTPGFTPNSVETDVRVTQNGGGESENVTLKAVLGIGTSRLQVGGGGWDQIDTLVDLDDPYKPGFAPGNSFTGNSLWAAKLGAEAIAECQPADPARPWPPYCSFAYAFDFLQVADYTNTWLCTAHCKTAAQDGSQIFVRTDAGTVAGTKLRVYYPDASTLVETYDNITTNEQIAAINDASAHLKVFSAIHILGDPTTLGVAQPIRNDYRQGVIDTVTYLWPEGVHHYEGPTNEPDMNAHTAHQMMLFQESVHQGNPDAKAIGPCPVNIQDLTGWRNFLEAGGGDYCDEFSTHMYNSQTGGDINQGRYQISRWRSLLEEFGYADKPFWSTESTNVFSSVYGSYHPRRSRIPVLQTLTLEQFGCPREKNAVWYDGAHGFNNYPSYLIHEDGSINPYGALYRTLAEETFYQLHHHAIDFGSVEANAIFLGSVYKSADFGISTAVIVSQSHSDDFSVTLAVTGTTDDLVLVDSWGNESTLEQTAGKVTVPIGDTPKYVRLTAGVDVYVDHVNDWDRNPPGSVSAYARATVSGVTAAPLLVDNTYATVYGNFVKGQWSNDSSESVPDVATVLFASSTDVDRVVVVGVSPWQPYSALVDFDVQTTTNGVDWTTRATVTKTSPTAINHPTSHLNAGCTYETFWDEQWIYDVKLPATYACIGVRLYVRQTSYGGEPIQAIDAGGYGQGNRYQHICLQELLIPSPSGADPYTASYVDLVSATSGLVAYYRLGESTGATTAVSEVNSPTVDGTRTYPDAVSVEGALAGNLANGGTVIAVPHSSTLNFADTFSIECWINMRNDDFGLGYYLFAKGTGAPSIRWDQGVLSLRSGATVVASTSIDIVDSVWHHVVITKNGSDTHIYVDAADVTDPGTNVTFTNTSTAMSVAGNGPDGFGPGRWTDEFAVYNVALSPTDVADHFNSSGTPAEVPAQDTAQYVSPEPKVSGYANVDEQIQSSSGYWTSFPNLYENQWQISANGTTGWTDVSGATRSDYITDTGDLGQYLRCGVTPSNVVGTGSIARSEAFGPIGAAISYDDPPSFNVPVVSVAPVVSGSPSGGATLSCSTGTWTNSPTSYQYRWQRSADLSSWATIGILPNTYTLTEDDLGAYIRCGVRATNADGNSVPAYSNALGPISSDIADGSRRRDRRSMGGARPHGRIRRA